MLLLRLWFFSKQAFMEVPFNSTLREKLLFRIMKVKNFNKSYTKSEI